MNWLVTLWLAGGLGLPANDIVSLVPIEGYFKSRGIKANARTMLELAGRDPADPPAQVRQLLAIRWLGENASQSRKLEGVRALLEQIRLGKKAQDAYGFASAHAAQALARLDGKPIPALSYLLERGLRGEAMAWLPADMPNFTAYELRPTRETNDLILQHLRKQILAAMDEAMLDQMYKAMDTSGNFRIDRISSGSRSSLKPGQPVQICACLTGKGNPQAIADMLAVLFREGKVEKKKSPRGEPVLLITTLTLSVAVVGDHDVLVAIDSASNALGFIQEMLEVRAGKKKDARQGSLGDLLRDAPDDACHLNVVELSAEQWAALGVDATATPGLPSRLVFHAVNRKNKLHLATQFGLKDKDEAKAFADLAQQRKEAGLKLLEAPVRIEPKLAKQWQQMLQAVKIEATGSRVNLTLTVEDAEALLAILKYVNIGQ